MADYGEPKNERRPDKVSNVTHDGSGEWTFLDIPQGRQIQSDATGPEIVFSLVTANDRQQCSVDVLERKDVLSGQTGAVTTQETGANHDLLRLTVPEDRLRRLLSTDADEGGPDPLQSLYGLSTYDEMVATLIRRIHAETTAEESVSSSLKVDGLLMTLLGTLLDDANTPDDTTKSTEVAPLDKRRLDRVLEHMDANLQKRIRIEDLASVACLSPFHFSRAFRAALGMPPHKFLTHRRIEASKDMLLNSSVSLSDIAVNCGFSSQAHFTRQFTRKMGMSPGKYRRSLR